MTSSNVQALLSSPPSIVRRKNSRLPRFARSALHYTTASQHEHVDACKDEEGKAGHSCQAAL